MVSRARLRSSTSTSGSLRNPSWGPDDVLIHKLHHFVQRSPAGLRLSGCRGKEADRAEHVHEIIHITGIRRQPHKELALCTSLAVGDYISAPC